MGKKPITDNMDEILYHCMSGVERKILDTLPDNEEIEYQFSDEFEQKMQTLIRREELKRKYKVPIKTWRRVAAMFLIVLTGFSVSVMSVDAVREKVFSYVRTIYDTYVSTHYFVREDVSNEFVPLYPTYLPEGYDLVIEDAGDEYLILEYESGKEKVITIYQQMILDEMVAHTDNELELQENCEIHGVNGKIIRGEDGVISIIWEKEQCKYTVNATNLTEDEIIIIAESLQ